VAIVTSLQSGRTWFCSPNWTTDLSLVQCLHPGLLPHFQGVPVVISKGKNMLDVESKNKIPSYVVVKNEWNCTPTPYYESTVRCLMKH
jgi:hypothetical protein